MGREILMGAFLELNTSHEKCRLISTWGKNTIKTDADKDLIHPTVQGFSLIRTTLGGAETPVMLTTHYPQPHYFRSSETSVFNMPLL